MMARRDGGRGDCCEGGSASAMKDIGEGRTAACGDEDEDDTETDDDVIEEDDDEAAELREAMAEAADCWCCARKVARASP